MTDNKDLFYIDKIISGDANAFAILVNKYKDMVFTLSVKLLNNKELAEENTQDVFLKAYHSISKFQRKSKFSTWLYRITYNECISILRKRKPIFVNIEDVEQSQINLSNEESFSEDVQEKKKIELNNALNELSETDRTIVVLHYFEKSSIDDISVITNLSKSNVKVRLFRSRQKLYKLLIHFFEKELVND